MFAHKASGFYSCAAVREITASLLLTVRKKMKNQREFEQALAKWVRERDGGDIPDCPIVDILSALPDTDTNGPASASQRFS